MIVLAEGNEQMRKIVCGVLTKAGHNVVDTSDGCDALQLVKKTHSDLLIADMYLTGKDGFEIIQTAKSEFPNLKILATANDVVTLKIAGLMGNVETLEKPFDVQELLETIDSLINRSGD